MLETGKDDQELFYNKFYEPVFYSAKLLSNLVHDILDFS